MTWGAKVAGIPVLGGGLYGLCALLALCAFQPGIGHAQTAPGEILAPGFPVATGFSGVRSAGTVDKITIDLDGPSLRVVDGSYMEGSPRGALVPAAKLLTVPAGQIGQVFAVTLDDAIPPNIYAAATSSYGLPIVVPDADGDGEPDRARRGAPDAQFMAGLFGGYPGTGPGTIWKVSGASGAVSLFANVTLDGAPNSGPALGGLAFDPVSRQILAADRETGMIHAFGLDGRERRRFDHGVEGLGAIGLPPVSFDPRSRLDIRSAAFDTEDPETWNYAVPHRRVFGLAVHRGRLYYAVAAGLRIWSVGLGPDGSFGNDARVEFAAPQGAVAGAEISKIIFDDDGGMVLAERGAPRGAYDFGALTAEGSGRVLRFVPKTPGQDGTPFFWQAAGAYAIGVPPEHRNGDGGIAIGYGYDADGFANTGVCGGTLWSTGSRLRMSPDPALAKQLAAGGALAVEGLQAHAISLIRPQNTPPLSSYFIDFDDVFADAQPGHMGDIATWRGCPGPLYPTVVDLLIDEFWCPAGFTRVRNACVAIACEPGEVSVRGRCIEIGCSPVRRTPVRGLCCPDGRKWNSKTRSCDTVEICPPERRARDGTCCETKVGTDGRCLGDQSCPPERRAKGGLCCDSKVDPKTGLCGNACEPQQQAANGVCCPAGMIVDVHGRCAGEETRSCPAGMVVKAGQCECIEGTAVLNGDGTCKKPDKPRPDKDCKDGFVRVGGKCVPPETPCTGGKVRPVPGMRCVCPAGMIDLSGQCQKIAGKPRGETECKAGTVWDGNKCHPDGEACTGGKIRLGNACVCPSGTVAVRGACQTVQTDPGGINCTGGSYDMHAKTCTCPRGMTLTPNGCQAPGGGAGDYNIPISDGCPGQTRRQPDGACRCASGSGWDYQTAGDNRAAVGNGICRPCTADEEGTPDGFCSPKCPPWEHKVWDATNQGREGDPPVTPGWWGSGYRCYPKTPPLLPCPPPQVRGSDGITCVTPLEQTIERRPPSCPAGLVWQSGRCCTPEAIAVGACGSAPPPPVAACPFPTFLVNGVCCTREAVAAGACGGRRPPPVSGCPPGQVKGDDGRCHERPTTRQCPPGQRWDGRRCIGGETETGRACPRGQVWNGRACVKQKETPPKPQCGPGQRFDGRRCVGGRTSPPGMKPPPAVRPKPGITKPLRPPPNRRSTPPFNSGGSKPITLPPSRGR